MGKRIKDALFEHLDPDMQTLRVLAETSTRAACVVVVTANADGGGNVLSSMPPAISRKQARVFMDGLTREIVRIQNVLDGIKDD